jgi:hypothetical protein
LPFWSFHRLLHTHHHLSSGGGTIGQIVANVPNWLSITPPKRTPSVLGTRRKSMGHGTRNAGSGLHITHGPYISTIAMQC